MKRITLSVLSLAMVATVGLTPAVAANREHQQLMADIRMLQEQSQQLQLMLTSLADALRTLNGRLDDQASVERKAFADQKLLIDNVSSDLRVVREKLDDTGVRVNSLSQEMQSMRDALNQLPAQLAPPVTMLPDGTMAPPADGSAPSTDAPVAGGTPAAVPAPTVPAGPAGGLSPQRMFDTAQADYAAGQWSLAIAGFEQYIRTFGNTDRADDAQFYIGESYQLDSKFKEAVTAYDKVIANYPTGDRVPQALYKRGVALSLLGDNDRARESFQQVIRNYPNSEVAVLARQVLDGLNRRPR
jgi:tol-pal system protein YbgF